MQQQEVSFYWVPAANQVHPANAPLDSRLITLDYQSSNGPCHEERTVYIERNTNNPNRQPEDFYTSTHRAPGTANPLQGRVVDEHAHWHSAGLGASAQPGHWTEFFSWHGHFLERFNQWRQLFGYPPIPPWYPGRPLPTGPTYDHAPRLTGTYDPDQHRIPWEFTLAGTPSPTVAWPNSPRLEDFPSLAALTTAFQSYETSVECAVGPPSTFGSLCDGTAPKDPMFWRWHAFADLVYRNYCTLKPLTCPGVVPAPASNPWMGDTVADIQAGGTPPSPGPHWVGFDIWNRTSEVNTPACIPTSATSPPHLQTVGGVTRSCGSEADHENPVSGQMNYLYATLRNTGTAPVRNLYAEVAVYIAELSTGVGWPADLRLLEDSRQFITLNLEPGQVTAIGPLPWTPPAPVNSDHWCLYIRVLSVQETPPVEGLWAGDNAMNSNSISARNVTIVNPQRPTRFIVRNISPDTELLSLEITGGGTTGTATVLQLDPVLSRASSGREGQQGVRSLGGGRYLVTGEHAALTGLRLPSRGEGTATLMVGTIGNARDIVITQRSRRGVDGGITFRVRREVAEPRQ